MVRVLLVRHGESTNNVLFHETFGAMTTSHGRDPPLEAVRRMADGFLSDDELTAKGHRQAAALASHWAGPLRSLQGGMRGRKVRFFCSAMRRPQQTALPLARALGGGVQIKVRDDLHEIGQAGPPVVGADTLARLLDESGKNLLKTTAADIRARAPGIFDVSGLPAAGPVLSHGGSLSGRLTRGADAYVRSAGEDGTATRLSPNPEFLDVAVKRAQGVAEWLRSDSLHDDVGDDGVVVLFAHGAINALVIGALLAMPPMVGFYALAATTPNTATSCLDVSRASGGRPCRMQWINDVQHLGLPPESRFTVEWVPNRRQCSGLSRAALDAAGFESDHFYVRPDDDRCFVLSKASDTCVSCQAMCAEKLNGTLATILEADAEELLGHLAPLYKRGDAHDGWWTGLYWYAGTWRWVSGNPGNDWDGQPFGWDNWAPSQPSNMCSELCVIMGGPTRGVAFGRYEQGQWYDLVNTNATHRCLCETPSEPDELYLLAEEFIRDGRRDDCPAHLPH
eukprot:g5083.t1